MGLDNYFRIECSEGETAPVVKMEREPTLTGGMFSGHGRGSFRGKVYATLIEDITGTSIYEDCIGPDTLVEMADEMDAHLAENPGTTMFKSDDWDVPRQELADLAMIFRAYGEAGYHLNSWY